MEDKDTLKLLKLIASDNYRLSEQIVNGYIEVTHKKCGHKFSCSIKDASLFGFHCKRCEDAKKNILLNNYQEIESMDLYNKCIEHLPDDYVIYGDTNSLESEIRVSWPGGADFNIVIGDLLSNRNLPDCLLHRDSALSTSIQLQILDKLIDDKLEILDDFKELTDEIRIKDNKNGTVTKETVAELVANLREKIDKNNEQKIQQFF
jgi:hypothetical protein